MLSVWIGEQLADVLVTARRDGVAFLVKLLEVVRVHPSGQDCAEKAASGIAPSLEIAREVGLQLLVAASVSDLSSLI